MNTTTTSRSDAIREALIGHVADTQMLRRWRWPAIGLVLAGAALGAGASTAAVAATGGFAVQQPAMPTGQPTPNLGDPVAAPPGTVPGSPIIALLGNPISYPVAAVAELPLTDRPAAATHLRVTVVPRAAGRFSWGTDPSGNNPNGAWGVDDIVAGTGTTWYDFPLDESTTTLYLDPADGFTGTVTLQYVTHIPTRLGVNARGETYGAEGGPDGVPDLVAVVGEAPDGSTVEGYARAVDLQGFSPDHPGMPSSPEEALEWQRERDEKYPDGWEIPVFESDGVTRIGVFRIGG